jgi:hypothetical protein
MPKRSAGLLLTQARKKRAGVRSLVLDHWWWERRGHVGHGASRYITLVFIDRLQDSDAHGSTILDFPHFLRSTFWPNRSCRPYSHLQSFVSSPMPVQGYRSNGRCTGCAVPLFIWWSELTAGASSANCRILNAISSTCNSREREREQLVLKIPLRRQHMIMLLWQFSVNPCVQEEPRFCLETEVDKEK